MTFCASMLTHMIRDIEITRRCFESFTKYLNAPQQLCYFKVKLGSQSTCYFDLLKSEGCIVLSQPSLIHKTAPSSRTVDKVFSLNSHTLQFQAMLASLTYVYPYVFTDAVVIPRNLGFNNNISPEGTIKDVFPLETSVTDKDNNVYLSLPNDKIPNVMGSLSKIGDSAYQCQTAKRETGMLLKKEMYIFDSNSHDACSLLETIPMLGGPDKGPDRGNLKYIQGVDDVQGKGFPRAEEYPEYGFPESIRNSNYLKMTVGRRDLIHCVPYVLKDEPSCTILFRGHPISCMDEVCRYLGDPMSVIVEENQAFGKGFYLASYFSIASYYAYTGDGGLTRDSNHDKGVVMAFKICNLDDIFSDQFSGSCNVPHINTGNYIALSNEVMKNHATLYKTFEFSKTDWTPAKPKPGGPTHKD